MNSLNAQTITNAALAAQAVTRAAATERLNENTLLRALTADAVRARADATAAFAAESGVKCKDGAPFLGGWSFFAYVGQGDNDDHAAVMAAIKRLGFRAKRHEVGDRNNRGATFYAKLTVSVGEIVTVTELGVDAVVVKIHADGDIGVRFEDGDEGSYSTAEVE